MNNSLIFHLAIPINDPILAKEFYHHGLGCQIGRENPHAIIFNFYGHQVVAHTTNIDLKPQTGVYPRHFGMIFDSLAAFNDTVSRARTHQLKFYLEPKLRFEGQILEHWTFFLEDPFYNLLEFKYYVHSEVIFGRVAVNAIGDR